MTDPLTQSLATEALDVLTEWFERAAVPTPHPPELEDQRVVWMTDGTFELWDQWGIRQSGPYRVTVLVEPADRFVPVNWGTVATECERGRGMFPVRLNGVEALVHSAVLQRWHVKPGTGTSKYNPPVREDYEVVHVVLDRGTYDMPPDGVVEMQLDPLGPAVSALLAGFPNMEVVTDVQN